jgi:hypothetical protein
MFNFIRREQFECRQLWNMLDSADRAVSLQNVLAEATPTLRAHAAQCDECHKRIEELSTARELLASWQPQAGISRPFFASRVMSAIAAREAELSRAINAWTIIPKLASRVAWAAALAILIAVGLLYQKPATSQLRTEPSPESLFDNAPSSASHDDVLVSMVEQE